MRKLLVYVPALLCVWLVYVTINIVASGSAAIQSANDSIAQYQEDRRAMQVRHAAQMETLRASGYSPEVAQQLINQNLAEAAYLMDQ